MRLVMLMLTLVLAATPLLAQVTPQPRPGDLPDSPHPWRVWESQRRTEALQQQRANKDLAHPEPEQLLYDVQSYDLTIDIDLAAQEISSTTVIRAVVQDEPLTALLLDFIHTNTVDAVRSGGVATVFEQSLEHLTVTLDRVYAPGELVEVAVDHHGDPSDAGNGFGWASASGQTLVWTLSEPYGARQWWPCKDYALDKADTVDLHVTVDSPYVVASNGVLVGQEEAGGRVTYHWRSSYPIATYLVSLAAYPYATFTDTYTAMDGITTMPVDNYVVPEYLEDAQAVYGLVPEMIGVLAQAYGEYPFLNEKYGHAHFTWGGGMEHQTCSSMIYWHHSEGLTVHELAHQWWGDLVTCADFHHVWLNEGFATWTEAYWLEQTQGREAYMDNLDDNRYTGSGTIYVENPLYFSDIFNLGLSYNKASWVVHMLRGILGDEDFFDGLALYRERFAYGAAVTEDLQQAMEDVSGRNLDSFFQRWIYGEGYPRYMVANIITPQGATSRIDVRIEQIQASDVFVMPFTLRINKADGTHEDVVVQNTHRDQYFVLTGPADAVSVLYDPDEWILRDLYLGTITDAPPAAAALELKAFPNPFNPSTTLALMLPTSGPVRLDIFDARGQRVCSVLDEHLEAGRHEVSWLGRDHRDRPVAAGTYYARVVSEGVTSVRSLSLVK